jgi:hypothetical protein
MKLTKEQLIAEIEKNGCKMMTGLPLKSMSLEAIVVHLEHCNCPKLKELKKKMLI